jgi:hypothetical protein
MVSDERAQRIQSQIKAQREFGQKGPNWDNYAVAQNVSYQDLDEGPDYRLDDAQRDRLIAHARQDASHATANASSILDALTRIRRLLRVSVVLQVAARTLPFIKRRSNALGIAGLMSITSSKTLNH